MKNPSFPDKLYPSQRNPTNCTRMNIRVFSKYSPLLLSKLRYKSHTISCLKNNKSKAFSNKIYFSGQQVSVNIGNVEGIIEEGIIRNVFQDIKLSDET